MLPYNFESIMKMFFRILSLFFFLCCNVSMQAYCLQAYYMHEVAEDSDGDPVGGVIALFIFFGLVYIFHSKDEDE